MTVYPISPPQFIRQHLLRMTVRDFAAALKVHETVASRYEQAGRIPEKHHERVLRLARERGIVIRPGWFKAVPWDPKARLTA